MNHARIMPVIVLVVILGVVLLPTNSIGYETFRRRPESLIKYQIDPNIDTSSGLRRSNNPSFIINPKDIVRQGAIDWDNSSAAIYSENTLTYNPSMYSSVTTANFSGSNECGGPPWPAGDLSPEIPGFVCWVYYSNGTVRYSKMLLNNNASYRWNTEGIHDNRQTPNDVDLRTVVEHEFGHFLWLGDGPAGHSEATMWYETIGAQQYVTEDDKQGSTQLYGPYTGFDSGKADGIQYNDAGDYTKYSIYKANVVNWFNQANTVPLMVNAGREQVDGIWINPNYGSRMLRIEGAATTNYAYVFWKLFSSIEDSGDDLGVKIPINARLKWCQYNFQQRSIGIDAYFSDGTSLREYSNVVDQNGTPLNPAVRNTPTGAWNCYDADLNPVAGKTVLHWYIAYDNRSTPNSTGKFRAYFDSIRFVWPNQTQKP